MINKRILRRETGVSSKDTGGTGLQGKEGNTREEGQGGSRCLVSRTESPMNGCSLYTVDGEATG